MTRHTASAQQGRVLRNARISKTDKVVSVCHLDVNDTVRFLMMQIFNKQLNDIIFVKEPPITCCKPINSAIDNNTPYNFSTAVCKASGSLFSYRSIPCHSESRCHIP